MRPNIRCFWFACRRRLWSQLHVDRLRSPVHGRPRPWLQVTKCQDSRETMWVYGIEPQHATRVWAPAYCPGSLVPPSRTPRAVALAVTGADTGQGRWGVSHVSFITRLQSPSALLLSHMKAAAPTAFVRKMQRGMWEGWHNQSGPPIERHMACILHMRFAYPKWPASDDERQVR